MVLTNVLLTIYLGVVSNFVKLSGLPDSVTPNSAQDVRAFRVGMGTSAFDGYVLLTNGNEFWIKYGVVQRYSSPAAYFANAGRRAIASSPGPSMTHAEAVGLASNVLVRLMRSAHALALGRPTTDQVPKSGEGKGRYYSLWWPGTNVDSAFPYGAAVEVDASAHLVTYMDLRDAAFYDLTFAAAVSNQVVRSNCLPARAPSRHGARPADRQVQEGIGGWLLLCEDLGIDSGSVTNINDVDWDGTYLYTNATLSSASAICFVRFETGFGFQAIGKIAFSAFTGDAAYLGDWGNKKREYWKKFEGRSNLRWQDLADKLERNLIQGLGVPESLVHGLTPKNLTYQNHTGEMGLTRILVQWTKTQKQIPADSSPSLLAEFDVDSGKLKAVTIWDKEICDILAIADLKARSSMR